MKEKTGSYPCNIEDIPAVYIKDLSDKSLEDLTKDIEEFQDTFGIDQEYFEVKLTPREDKGFQVCIENVIVDAIGFIINSLDWCSCKQISKMIEVLEIEEEQAFYFTDFLWEELETLLWNDDELFGKVFDFYMGEEIKKICTFLKKLIDEVGFTSDDLEFFEQCTQKN
ncbi:MAG: hypothetical protein QM387_00680 [Spirochaetota bacterium]|jgi:hypothetical protein|nr:hypothetical protein [Spirochaetota bacterium]